MPNEDDDDDSKAADDDDDHDHEPDQTTSDAATTPSPEVQKILSEQKSVELTSTEQTAVVDNKPLPADTASEPSLPAASANADTASEVPSLANLNLDDVDGVAVLKAVLGTSAV